MNKPIPSAPPADYYHADLFTRRTDPSESHVASEQVKHNIGNDRKECFFRFCAMLRDGCYYGTRTVFQFDYLIACGLTPLRAKSLCRRISDLVVRKNNPLSAALWLLCKTGEKVDGSAILTLTERGRMVQDDPGLMAGLWNQTKDKKKPPGA